MSKKLSESVVRRMIVIAVADLAIAGDRRTGDVVKKLKAEAIKYCEEGGLPIYMDDDIVIPRLEIQKLLNLLHKKDCDCYHELQYLIAISNTKLGVDPIMEADDV